MYQRLKIRAYMLVSSIHRKKELYFLRFPSSVASCHLKLMAQDDCGRLQEILRFFVNRNSWQRGE